MTASEAIEFLLTQPTYSPYAKILRPLAYQGARESGLINDRTEQPEVVKIGGDYG